MRVRHRKRTKTVEKAKVAAAAWGTEFIQFIAVLAVLHQDVIRVGHPVFSKERSVLSVL